MSGWNGIFKISPGKRLQIGTSLTLSQPNFPIDGNIIPGPNHHASLPTFHAWGEKDTDGRLKVRDCIQQVLEEISML